MQQQHNMSENTVYQADENYQADVDLQDSRLSKQRLSLQASTELATQKDDLVSYAVALVAGRCEGSDSLWNKHSLLGVAQTTDDVAIMAEAGERHHKLKSGALG